GISNATGILINGSDSVNYINVTIRDCPAISAYKFGVYLHKTAYDTVQNVSSFNNSLYGFLLLGSTFNNLTNNNGYNNTNGFYLSQLSNNNTIKSNRVWNNSYYGIALGGGAWYNTIIDNEAFENAQHGFAFGSGARYNIITNNSAHDNNGNGFYFILSSDNNLANNLVYNNSQHGFYLYSNSDNNTLTKNTAYNNSGSGFHLIGSNYTDFISNTAYNNFHGFYLLDCFGSNLTDIVSRGNVQNGIYIEGGSAVAANLHLYNNTDEIGLTGGGAANINVNITNATIDNPTGSFENRTSITLINYTDTGSGQGIRIRWNPKPATLPPGYLSFRQKYVNITYLAFQTTIPLIRFTWLDSEVSGYDENRFELWKHDGTNWSYESSQTLSTTDNYIEVLNFQPSSVYGILQKPSGPQPPPSGGGGEEHKHRLYIYPIEPQYAIINQVKTVQIYVKNIGDYNEYDVKLFIEPNPNFVCGNASLGTIARADVKNGSINITGMKIGSFVLKAEALSEHAYAFREFNFTVLPQCENNSACNQDEYCEDGLCLKVECERGYVQDHSCIPYECYNDSDCSDFEKCENHTCVPINYSVYIATKNVTVGDNFTGFVYADGTPASNLTIAVVLPNGYVVTFISDKYGRFVVPAILEGKYEFYLQRFPSIREYGYAYSKPVVVIKPKKIKEEIPPPKGAPGECCLLGVCYELAGICWYYWVLMLILLFVIMILYKKISARKR
ncbi:MAG: right-handed parallel beta-helix repeat-containing protein, partial [Candidatus Bilamarchaeaceae archaeon]